MKITEKKRRTLHYWGCPRLSSINSSGNKNGRAKTEKKNGGPFIIGGGADQPSRISCRKKTGLFCQFFLVGNVAPNSSRKIKKTGQTSILGVSHLQGRAGPSTRKGGMLFSGSLSLLASVIQKVRHVFPLLRAAGGVLVSSE